MVLTKKVYRYLVLISLGTNMVWTFFREIYWGHFDVNMQKLLSADGYGSVLPGAEYLFWSILTVSLICYVGLLYFKRWAVWLLIVLDVIVLLFLAPFGGVEISLPIERIAKNIFLMVDGVLITLAFFSDLKSQFNSPEKLQPNL